MCALQPKPPLTDRTFAPKMPTCPSPPRHPGSDFFHRTLAYSLPEFHKLGVIEYMPSLGLAPSTPSKGVCPLAAVSLSGSESFAHHGRSSPSWGWAPGGLAAPLPWRVLV